MSNNSNVIQFRPINSGNDVVDKAFRQAFDYLYQLQAQVSSLQIQVAALQDKVK